MIAKQLAIGVIVDDNLADNFHRELNYRVLDMYEHLYHWEI